VNQSVHLRLEHHHRRHRLRRCLRHHLRCCFRHCYCYRCHYRSWMTTGASIEMSLWFVLTDIDDIVKHTFEYLLLLEDLPPLPLPLPLCSFRWSTSSTFKLLRSSSTKARSRWRIVPSRSPPVPSMFPLGSTSTVESALVVTPSRASERANVKKVFFPSIFIVL
jgi:hypothetical protein